MESEIAKQLALVRAVSEKVQFLSDSIDSGQDANVHGQSVSMRTRLLEQLQQIHGTLTDLGGALVPTGPDNRHDDVCGLQASQPLQTDAGQQPLEQPTAGTNSPSLREIVERLRQELHAAKESESTPVPPSQSLIEPPATSRSLQSVVTVTPSHKAEVLPPRRGSAKSIDSDDRGLASYLSFQEDSLIDRLQGSQSSASGHVQVELMSEDLGETLPSTPEQGARAKDDGDDKLSEWQVSPSPAKDFVPPPPYVDAAMELLLRSGPAHSLDAAPVAASGSHSSKLEGRQQVWAAALCPAAETTAECSDYSITVREMLELEGLGKGRRVYMRPLLGGGTVESESVCLVAPQPAPCVKEARTAQGDEHVLESKFRCMDTDHDTTSDCISLCCSQDCIGSSGMGWHVKTASGQIEVSLDVPDLLTTSGTSAPCMQHPTHFSKRREDSTCFSQRRQEQLWEARASHWSGASDARSWSGVSCITTSTPGAGAMSLTDHANDVIPCHSRQFLRARQAIIDQRSRLLDADIDQGVRWLHTELQRLLSDFTVSCMRLWPSRALGRRPDIQTISHECRAEEGEAFVSLARAAEKGHISQHQRFNVTQLTIKDCLKSHTSPQLLRAWARMANAIFALPLSRVHLRWLVRNVRRLQICRVLCRHGAAGGRGHMTPDHDLQALPASPRDAFQMWCIAHSEYGRQRRRKEAILCATTTWAVQAGLVRVLRRWRRWHATIHMPLVIAGAAISLARCSHLLRSSLHSWAARATVLKLSNRRAPLSKTVVTAVTSHGANHASLESSIVSGAATETGSPGDTSRSGSGGVVRKESSRLNQDSVAHGHVGVVNDGAEVEIGKKHTGATSVAKSSPASVMDASSHLLGCDNDEEFIRQIATEDFEAGCCASAQEHAPGPLQAAVAGTKVSSDTCAPSVQPSSSRFAVVYDSFSSFLPPPPAPPASPQHRQSKPRTLESWQASRSERHWRHYFSCFAEASQRQAMLRCGIACLIVRRLGALLRFVFLRWTASSLHYRQMKRRNLLLTQRARLSCTRLALRRWRRVVQEFKLMCFHLRSFLTNRLRVQRRQAFQWWNSQCHRLKLEKQRIFTLWEKTEKAREFATLGSWRRCRAFLHVWHKHLRASETFDESPDLRLELDLLHRRWSTAKKIKSLSGWQGMTIARRQLAKQISFEMETTSEMSEACSDVHRVTCSGSQKQGHLGGTIATMMELSAGEWQRLQGQNFFFDDWLQKEEQEQKVAMEQLSLKKAASMCEIDVDKKANQPEDQETGIMRDHSIIGKDEPHEPRADDVHGTSSHASHVDDSEMDLAQAKRMWSPGNWGF